MFYNLENLKKTQQSQSKVECSYLEIYNEQVLDLLDPSSPTRQVREHMKTGVFVEGAVENEVKSAKDIYEIIKQGTVNRHVSSTEMNKESSRSHAILTLKIERKQDDEDGTKIITSQFHIVDLAGSERAKRSNAEGVTIREAGNINKSLANLGKVIHDLVEVNNKGRQYHIHYRDSKLTFLLK